jgi:hypothetical protein
MCSSFLPKYPFTFSLRNEEMTQKKMRTIEEKGRKSEKKFRGEIKKETMRREGRFF